MMPRKVRTTLAGTLLALAAASGVAAASAATPGYRSVPTWYHGRGFMYGCC
jgi:hypothetical protein